jgi:CRP/FNR family cyclic AMP-dependent transcriptional regulator
MASKKQHLETLRGVALFSGCSIKELEKVAKASDEIRMTAGTLIVDQGQTGREAFVVLDGEVDIKRNGRKVATLGAGSVVGELSLLDHGPRTATAICTTDCTLLVIDQRRFLGVIDAVPSISHKLLASLAARIRELDRQYFG